MTTKKLFASEKLEEIFGRLTFGDTLQAWRTKDELSQTAFAKRLGIHELVLIQLALRDSLYKDGFKYEVKLTSAS